MRTSPSRPTEDAPAPASGSAMRWRAGDGTRSPRSDSCSLATRGRSTHQSVLRRLHRGAAAAAGDPGSRAHGAGPADERAEERENRFRLGELPVLFCSPTMELRRTSPSSTSSTCGTSRRRRELCAVEWSRGRSRKPASSSTTARPGNSHDQYFFRVRHYGLGLWSAPRLDLTNEDLVRAHVHARLAGRVGSLARFVVSGDPRSSTKRIDVPTSRVEARVAVRSRGHPARPTARRAHSRGSRISTTPSGTRKLGSTRRFTAPSSRSIAPSDRWRGLDRAAIDARETQHDVILDQSRSPAARNMARRLRHEAEAQIEPPRRRGAAHGQSDFYSYRYRERGLPRLQLPTASALGIYPARRARQGRDEFLQRPRFLAISEFGPQHRLPRGLALPHQPRPSLAERMENRLPTTSVQCTSCGYLHPLADGDPGLDLREHWEHRSTSCMTSSASRTSRPGAVTASTPTRRSASASASRSGPVRFARRDGERRVAHIASDGTAWGS